MSLCARLTDLPDGHPSIRDDMDRRYHQTFLVKTNEKGEKEIVYYYQRDGHQLYFQNEQQKNYKVSTADEAQIEVFLPEIGYYNIQGNPYYMIKNPKKQWKRSFTSGIYAFQGPNAALEGREPTREHSMWTLAKACLNPLYVTLDDITNKLFANVALSKKFAVALDKQGQPVLLYRRYTVGQLDFDNNIVIVNQPQLLQEVQDLFKYTGVNKWTLK